MFEFRFEKQRRGLVNIKSKNALGRGSTLIKKCKGGPV